MKLRTVKGACLELNLKPRTIRRRIQELGIQSGNMGGRRVILLTEADMEKIKAMGKK